jgi:hypothetical protein
MCQIISIRLKGTKLDKELYEYFIILGYLKLINMKFNLLCLITTSCIFISCTASKDLVKFNEKPEEVYTNGNLKEFLKKNPQANIVLRIPNSSEDVTSKNTNDKTIVTSNPTMDIYYNAIEKEFLKSGFSVRDRGLFNEVLRKMSRNETENINYSQIKDITNTDLILEVIKIDPRVEYVTNKTYKQNSKGKVTNYTSYREYKKYGASAEFKIIMVKNNEMAGTYTFNYAPCIEGCPASSFAKPLNLRARIKPAVEGYEGVEVNLMEEFIKNCSRDLIAAMKS